MRYILALSLLLSMTLLATPSWAIDLYAAKSQNLVGEQADGLVGIVTPPGSPDVQQLVKTTNEGRLKLYQTNAAQQNLKVEDVQAISGKTLIEKTPAGQMIMGPDGHWRTKQ